MYLTLPYFNQIIIISHKVHYLLNQINHQPPLTLDNVNPRKEQMIL